MLSVYGRSETEWTGTNGITDKRTLWRKKLTAIPLSMPTNQSTDGVYELERITKTHGNINDNIHRRRRDLYGVQNSGRHYRNRKPI